MKVIRVSLPGVDARTSTDPNDFALFADEDNVLLKEESRGNLASGGSYAHNLGYIPFYLTFGEISAGLYQVATGWDAVSGIPRSRTTPTTLKTASGAIKYFVFYDNMD